MESNNIKKAGESLTLESYKHTFGGCVAAIASKSHAHRLLIASGLGRKEVDIICDTTSKDIEATVNCMNSLGASITREGNVYHVIPVGSRKDAGIRELDCGESGSTLRFLIPVIAALGMESCIEMHGRLPERPLSPLYEELELHGIKLSPQGSNPLQISGKLPGGDYTIAGSVSSQYISGLLFALPLVDAKESRIIVTGKLESRPYIDITLSVIRAFGIEVSEENGESETIFRIPGGQSYEVAAESLTVEGDWSNAAFFLALGAIQENPVTVTGLNTLNSLQGDRRIISLLEAFGADVDISEKRGSVTISRGGSVLHGIEIDASNIPDLVPILAVVASLSEGTTNISNIGRLRIKESDRVETVIATITSLGGDITVCDEGNGERLVIKGKPLLTGGAVDSFNDHRIAMAAGIASVRAKGDVTIINPEAVNKSYPGFYTDLGGLTIK